MAHPPCPNDNNCQIFKSAVLAILHRRSPQQILSVPDYIPIDENFYQTLNDRKMINGISSPQISKLSSGAFSDAIFGVSKNRLVYVIKNIVQTSDRKFRNEVIVDVPLGRTYARGWAQWSLHGTKPEKEAQHLIDILNDRDIARWNEKELKIRPPKIENGAPKRVYLFNTRLIVGLAETVFQENDKNKNRKYVAVLHAAKGEQLTKQLIAKTEGEKDKNDKLLRILGAKMARFHIATKKAHLDLHSHNIFYDHHKALFTLIDNHSLMYSNPSEKRPDYLSLLFGFDREYFTQNLRHFLKSQAKEFADFEGTLSVYKKAFGEGYKSEFERLVKMKQLPYTYEEKIVKEEY